MSWLTTLPLTVIDFLRRHPGLLALFGFFSGLASFVLIERKESVAQIIAIMMLVSWIWLMLEDRKSTRLNSSHVRISYAVFCLKKKKITHQANHITISSPPITFSTPPPPTLNNHFALLQSTEKFSIIPATTILS